MNFLITNDQNYKNGLGLNEIYHKDFNNLYSTLHKVNSVVDTGDILEMKKIKISK